MKVFDIFFNWCQGLWTSGNIILIFLAMILYAIGYVLVLIGYILQLGFRVFFIFLDESLYYASVGQSYLKKTENNLKSILQLIDYYFKKLLDALLSSNSITIPIKPTLKIDIALSILLNTLFAIFFYGVSIIIFLIATYWLLTYAELLCLLGDLILPIFNTSYSLLENLKKLLNAVQVYIEKKTSISIFNIAMIWVIRIVGFFTVFLFRYFRVKSVKPDLSLKDLIPFKSKFKNEFWKNQSKVNSNYRLAYSIAFSILIVLLVAGIIFFSNKSQSASTDKDNIGVTDLEDNNDSAKQITTIPEPKKDTAKVLSTVQVVEAPKAIIPKETIKAIPYEEDELDVAMLDKLMNNAIISVKAEEYDDSMKQLDRALKLSSMPSGLRKQIIAAKSFVKAREDADAIKILNQIIAEN